MKVKWAAALGALLVAAAVVAAVARALQFDGAAKPGVHVLGMDVGGQGVAPIERELRAWVDRPVTIGTRGRSYHVRRGWLVAVDARATAKRALDAGSLDSLIVSKRIDVQPVLRRTDDARNVLEAIARSGRAPVDATVRVQGTGVVTTPARDGLRLDRAMLLQRLAQNRPIVEAPYRRVAPTISDAEAEHAAATARSLLAGPMTVEFRGTSVGSLTPVQLAHALRIDAARNRIGVSLDGEALARVLRPRLGPALVRPRNARFLVTGDRVRIAPSKPGRDIDSRRLVAAIVAAARGDRAVRVPLRPRQPTLTTAGAESLGIQQKLVSYTTQMGESSANRIHNVHLMADLIDGTIIKPGQAFSFNRVVGPRTASRGFLEGQEIVGSLVLPSIGGGVCQTATTLFNDAFELGLPILQRTNHNLYLSHYPLGRDATVAWGGPDLQFKNDLDHALLIKTSYTDTTLTFVFYGTSEHRRVVSQTGPQTNWTSPSMSYAVDPSAPPGSIRVVPGSGEQGFDVLVTRTVYDAAGKVLRRDMFKSHYIPDNPTTVYGPGRTPPGPYIVLPTSPT
jgi:vancomycin resistance protein YoaR